MRAPLAFLLFAAAFAGCSGGGSSLTAPAVRVAAPLVSASPSQAPFVTATPGPAVAACTDCWPMFMHDVGRTGDQTTQTTMTSTNVAQMSIRWSYLIDEQTTASPVVADGDVFVATGAGSVYAFDERTGTPVWHVSIGGPITMTPTVDGNTLFVATHSPPAQFFALDATTGATLWQTSFPGSMRGEPLAIGGVVYVPESGGDPAACHQGGIRAYNELTGSPLWHWVVNSTPDDGGSVWSPISYDGTYLVFGTGNGCSLGITNANSVVRLTLAGAQNWVSPPQVNSEVDDDWGGAVAVSGSTLYAANKNGKLYAFSSTTGAIVWESTQSTIDGDGAIGSPATNGSILVAPSGFVTSPQTDPTGFVGGYSLAGTLLWSVPTHDFVPGGAALTNDVAFVSIDTNLVAVRLSDGKNLWSYPSAFAELFYAAPAVVSSGVYAVDERGAVYALSLGTTASTSAQAAERLRAQARSAGPPRMPYGSILKKTPGGAMVGNYGS